MICEHPGCTGVHGTDKPEAMLCPRTLARKRERNRKWMAEHYTGTAADILSNVRDNARKRGS